MKLIAIAGASGYIGRNLIASLTADDRYQIKLLTRAEIDSRHAAAGAEIVKGDLLSPESLRGFLEPGCIVINLVYLWGVGPDANICAMRNLVAACKAVGIDRMIHVSTAAVSGHVNENLITEAMPCKPVSEYGMTKLHVESFLRDESRGCFDLAILRPTSVFGPGAEPLSKLVQDLLAGRRLQNYLKSSLFGKRRMNLVNVANVTAAIVFLASRAERLAGEVFIVSDDDVDNNNFQYVESALMRGFRVPAYVVPRMPVPLHVLRLLLLLLGRNNVNPLCNYSNQKLQRLGFIRPIDFDAGLSDYIAAHPALLPTQIELHAGT